ncbi:hypothetical protein [Sphingomonas pituitosa]|uniref:hypothetical protein n=1 Tax=Sphingomonas pituitosa TaxID=99597 RepID=UPI001FDF4F42|nr:hypothetical protein [Sphingomonas pituitosa]
MAMAVPGLASATTIRVENRSNANLKVSVKHAPGDVLQALPPTLSPHAIAFVRRPNVKVLTPTEEAKADLIDIIVTDRNGRGCHFRTIAEPHSDALVLIVPVATAIGSAHCEARTGRTIGDFVFLAS